LFELEKSLCKDQQLVLYVIYKDELHDKWMIQAVPVYEGSFQSRLPLHEAWRGRRNEELDSICGLLGTVFVHATGFIGAHSHLEGAIQMGVTTMSLTTKPSK